MKLAYERWTVEDKSIVDDITLILIFFEHQKDTSVEWARGEIASGF